MNKHARHLSEVLFTIGLFCVFSISAISIVVIGAKVYKTTVKNMDKNYTSRTAAAYIMEKARQHDTKGGVKIVQLSEDMPALALYDGDDTVTYIYCYKDKLCELVTSAGSQPYVSGGEKLLPAKSIAFEQDSHGIYKVCIENIDGKVFSIDFYLKSVGEDGGAI